LTPDANITNVYERTLKLLPQSSFSKETSKVTTIQKSLKWEVLDGDITIMEVPWLFHCIIEIIQKSTPDITNY